MLCHSAPLLSTFNWKKNALESHSWGTYSEESTKSHSEFDLCVSIGKTEVEIHWMIKNIF